MHKKASLASLNRGALKALYSFRPRVAALVNKNAFANLLPYNTVNTATGTSIAFVPLSVALFALVFLGIVIASAWLWLVAQSMFIVIVCIPVELWVFHHLFGAPLFTLAAKRLRYVFTKNQVCFERDGVRDCVPLRRVVKAFVLPTATMGLFGYHNVAALYVKGRSLHAFYLYGAPNKDLQHICALLTSKQPVERQWRCH